MLHKLFKKIGPDLHIFANSVILLVCLGLLAVIVVLVLKHEKLKMAMVFFANQAAIASKQRYVGAEAVEAASTLATTIVTVPAGSPLWGDKVNLEKLVMVLSQQTGRDIVVEDTTQKILADTFVANVGNTYSFANKMDAQTMKDGKSRRFTESSRDYPSGIDEVVVPVKSNGTIVGAVIMSTSRIFEDK